MSLELPSKSPEIRQSEIEPAAMELSIVMPCLNEAETLEICIRKARQALDEHGIVGEVVIADNGSTERLAGYRNRRGRTSCPGYEPRLRQCFDGRHKQCPWNLHHHGRRR